MARIRTIKPEFWTDEKLTECSLSARLLFIGTWNFADDSGNLDRSAKQIKARVFPIDNIDCEPLIQELITQGLLTEYSVIDKKYLHIQGFTKHQLINRPSKPSCPEFDGALVTQATLTEPSLSTHDGREGKGREVIKHTPDKPAAFNSKTYLLEAGVEASVVDDWLTLRKSKRAAVTITAIHGIEREAKLANWTLGQALTACCERGWQGFKAEFVANLKPMAPPPTTLSPDEIKAKKQAETAAGLARMKQDEAKFIVYPKAMQA